VQLTSLAAMAKELLAGASPLVPGTRLKQIVEWLRGGDGDPLIVFDVRPAPPPAQCNVRPAPPPAQCKQDVSLCMPRQTDVTASAGVCPCSPAADNVCMVRQECHKAKNLIPTKGVPAKHPCAVHIRGCCRVQQEHGCCVQGKPRRPARPCCSCSSTCRRPRSCTAPRWCALARTLTHALCITKVGRLRSLHSMMGSRLRGAGRVGAVQHGLHGQARLLRVQQPAGDAPADAQCAPPPAPPGLHHAGCLGPS